MKTLGYKLALFALLCLAAGCGAAPSAAPAGDDNDSTISESVGSGQRVDADETEEQEQPDKLTIQAYYTDESMTDVLPASREIEVTGEDSKYEGTFKALQAEESGWLSLWKNVVLHDIAFDENNGQLSIDVGLPDEARLGAGGESLAIKALKNAMFQFDEVERIELTVDGKQVESLMGHETLEYPMTRSSE